MIFIIVSTPPCSRSRSHPRPQTLQTRPRPRGRVAAAAGWPWWWRGGTRASSLLSLSVRCRLGRTRRGTRARVCSHAHGARACACEGRDGGRRESEEIGAACVTPLSRKRRAFPPPPLSNQPPPPPWTASRLRSVASRTTTRATRPSGTSWVRLGGGGGGGERGGRCPPRPPAEWPASLCPPPRPPADARAQWGRRAEGEMVVGGCAPPSTRRRVQG